MRLQRPRLNIIRMMLVRMAVALMLGLFSSHVQGHNILVISADPGSHVMFMTRIASLFRSRGHNVTVLLGSNVKISEEVQKLNITILKYHNPYPIATELPDMKANYDLVMKDPSMFNQLKLIKHAAEYSRLTLAPLYMEDKVLLEHISRASFDYVIVDVLVASSLYLPYKFDIPYGLVTIECFGHLRRIPYMPSYVPPIMTPYSDDMTLAQRLATFWFTLLSQLLDFGGEDISLKYVPERPAVSLSDLLVNASLCFQMKDNSVDFIRPLMPDVILFGVHLARPGGPLPADLQQYMDQAPHGVILISFGTAVSVLSQETLQKLFGALKQLEYNVIFKYSNDLTEHKVPEHVKVVKWMPQNDILAHPNMKAFVTHCGLNSYLESVYHAVPMLAAPYFWDQYGNAAIVKSKQLGDIVHLNDFTQEELVRKINDVATNDTYRESVSRRAAIFKDIKSSGVHDPVFWVEHVIKHGARHLRSQAYDMSLFTYFMLDIMIISLLIASVFAFLLYILCKIGCSACIYSSEMKKIKVKGE